MKYVNWMLHTWILDTEGTMTHFTMKKEIINKGMITEQDREIE